MTDQDHHLQNAAATEHIDTAPAKQPWSRAMLAGAALITGLAIVVYLPALKGKFIFDDDLLLTQNPLIRTSGGLLRFWYASGQPAYTPLASDTYWIEWRLWGANPTGYHVSNLLLHIAAALLLWAVLRRLSIPGAFLASLLFAVHPVNVESVAWIAQRKGMLAMPFFLLSILWYLRAEAGTSTATIEQPGTARTDRWYWLSLLAFALAVFSKGSAAILPLVLLGIVVWQRRLTRDDWKQLAPFFLIAALIAVKNILVHQTGEAIRSADLAERLAGAGGVVWFYLAKALAPIDLVFVYPQWHIQTADVRWWLPLLACVVVTAALWRQRRSPPANWGRALLYAWGFFCVALVPVLGLADVGYMRYTLVADHYQHIALISVCALAAAVWSAWHQRAQNTFRAVTIIIAAGIVCTLAALAWNRSRLYADPLVLYTETLEKNPDCWMIPNNLGNALIDLGRTQEAVGYYQRALRQAPDVALTHYNLARTLSDLGQIAAAIPEYQEAVRLEPESVKAHYALGLALAEVDRTQEAIQQYQRALEIRPNLFDVHTSLADALVRVGQIQEATAHYQTALNLNPNYGEAEYGWGLAELKNNHPQQAIEHLVWSVRLKPNDPEAYRNLASAFDQTGHVKEAIVAAEKGLEVAKAGGKTELAGQIENWLTNYRKQHPQPPSTSPPETPQRAAP